MVAGSIYVVHRVFVIVAIASHSFVDDCLKDLQARILLKPLASTPHGPPDPFVLSAACLTMSPFISDFIKLYSTLLKLKIKYKFNVTIVKKEFSVVCGF